VGNSYANGSSIKKVESLSLPSDLPRRKRCFASRLRPDASAFVGFDKLAGDVEIGTRIVLRTIFYKRSVKSSGEI